MHINYIHINTAQSFQRLIDWVLRGIPLIYTYINDILVTGKNTEEHKDYLHQAFQRLSKFDLNINIDKCTFSASQITFPVHVIDQNEI